MFGAPMVFTKGKKYKIMTTDFPGNGDKIATYNGDSKRGTQGANKGKFVHQFTDEDGNDFEVGRWEVETNWVKIEKM